MDEYVNARGGRSWKGLLYAILVPPLFFAPLGIPLYLLGVGVDVLKDLWYLGMFTGCIWLAHHEKTPLSQIGLTMKQCGMSLFLAIVWELVTFFLMGVPMFVIAAGRLPFLMSLDVTMIRPLLHFMIVGLAEETQFRGLVLRRFLDLNFSRQAAVVGTTLLFVLFHLPAVSPMILQDPSILPLLLWGWSQLFLWSAGLAVIVLKTGNLLGPIVLHGLDDFVSKVLLH